MLHPVNTLGAAGRLVWLQLHESSSVFIQRERPLFGLGYHVRGITDAAAML